MASYIDSQGNYYTGEKVPGGIEVNAKPSANYKLKSGWTAQIPDVWEYDTASAKSKLITDNNAAADQKFLEILSKYPKGEVDTWPTKAALAQTWVNYTDPEKVANIAATDFALLFMESVNKSIILEEDIPTVTDLAVRIIRSKNIYSTFAGAVLNKKTQTASLINAAETEDELNQIIIDYSSVNLGAIAAYFTPNAVPAAPTDTDAVLMTVTITETGKTSVDYKGETVETVQTFPQNVIGSVITFHVDQSYTLTLPDNTVSNLQTVAELNTYLQGG
jgi:hypothetical protein